MANFTSIDFPPLSHNPNRRPITYPTRPVTHPTRPVTHPTRSLTHPGPSILGNPPKMESSTRGGGGGWKGGSHRGSGSHSHDHNNDDGGGGGDLCEKFDELEVIEESIQLAKNSSTSIYSNVVNVNVKDDDDNNSNSNGNKIVSDEIPVEASGENVPKAVSRFEEMKELGFELHDNIKRCNYVKPTPIQCHAIPILMAGRDLMACAQTGSGKTAAFCFPIIAGIVKNAVSSSPFGGGGGGGGYRGRGRTAYPVALIMSPTRELSSQIHDEAKKFAHQTGVKVVVAYGGTPMSEQLRNLERGVDILVATPGRLVDIIERGRVSLSKIKYFALDEADSMLDMGFEPQIRRIAEEMDMPPTGSRQTMLFSATFPTEIQRLASDFLSNYIFLTVGKVGSSNDMIEQKIELVDDYDKRRRLKDLLLSQKRNGTQGKPPLTIVFAETKRSVDNLANWLSESGFPATAIHGDKVQMERERALRSFKNGATPIIVATDVAARGLDIPCVAHVINYDLPKDIEHYVHRIGRTGRAGKSGLATAFFCDKDRPISKALVELMEEANQVVPPWLTEYAHSSSSYGSGYGGGRRPNRGGKFGGRDYRSFDRTDFSNSYTGSYSNNYTDNVPKPAFTENYTSAYTDDFSKPAYTEDYTTTYVAEVPKVGSLADYCSRHGYDNIVATGWD